MRKILLALLFVPLLCQAKPASLNPDTLIKKFTATQSERDHGAVVLYKKKTVNVAEDGAHHHQLDIAVAILNQKALGDYSEIELHYDNYYQAISKLHVETINEDGQIIRLPDDAIHDQKASQDQFYDNSRAIRFSPRGLKLGSIIRFRFHSEGKRPRIENHWFADHHFHYIQDIPVSNSIRLDPVRVSEYEVRLPSSKKLTFSEHQITEKPTIEKQADQNRYTWIIKNLNTVKIEQNMPHLYELVPNVEMTTLANWSEVDRWAHDQVKPALTRDADVDALAKSLAKSTDSVKKKSEAVFHYVQKNIRYVYAHVNRNGYSPHHASEVLKNRYGDCKDQSALIVSLLRSLGVKAQTSLVNTYADVVRKDSLPSLGFNHMIVSVQDQNRTYWLDTSGDTGVYPGLSSAMDGSYALVLGRGQTLTQIMQARHNMVEYDTVYSEAENGKVQADVTLHFQGAFDTYTRSWLKEAPNQQEALNQYVSNLFNRSELRSATASDVYDLGKSFTITGQLLLERTGDNEAFSFDSNIATLIEGYSGISDLPDPLTRKHGYIVPIAYELRSTTSYKSTDDGHKATVIQSGVNYDNAYFSMQHQYPKKGRDISIETILKVKKKRIPVREYKQFVSLSKNAMESAESNVFYHKEAQHVARDINTGTTKSDLLSQARAKLSASDFESARSFAEKGIKSQPQEAEFYYILGVALGFLDDYEKSEQYLLKAENMGYQP